MSQLSEIRTDVQSNWPSGFHSSDLDSNKIDEFINKIQREVCRVHNFTWMEKEIEADTVDEQRRYAVPDGTGTTWKYKDEISCELMDYNNYRKPLQKLFKKSIEENRLFKDTTAKGTPTHYCVRAGYIELWKLPDHAANNDTAFTINFEFYGYLADLSDDTDTNEITNQYPLVLEYGATALGFRFGLDIEMAEYYESKAAGILVEMIKEDNSRKFSSIEEGMRPARGQSIGGERREVLDLKAHYE